MTRERIKDFKEIVLPFVTNYLLKKNYENLGKSDAEEFEKDFSEIIELADKALEQQPCEDTISRQAAIDVVKGIDRSFVKYIEELPPAEPEIIRCKDCKHWIPYDWMFSEVWQSKNIADYPEDEIGCNYCDMAMKANDFCSRGERKNDG